jgi:hypothetical protein
MNYDMIYKTLWPRLACWVYLLLGSFLYISGIQYQYTTDKHLKYNEIASYFQQLSLYSNASGSQQFGRYWKISNKGPQSRCWSPRSSVIISMTNSQFFINTLAQIESLKIHNLWECMEDRFIIIGIDSVTRDANCTTHRIKHCITATNIDYALSDFRMKDYYSIIYLKWDIAAIALQYFKFVFIFDADVALLQNPWKFIPTPLLSSCDMHFQVELRDTPMVNSGQMMFRRSGESMKVISYIKSKRKTPRRLDQSFVLDGVQLFNASLCRLDQDLFLGIHIQ